MNRILRFFRRTSFSLKIMLTVLLTAVLMVALTLISMLELSRRTEERLLYLIGSSYDQVRSGLEEKVAAVYSASTLITTSQSINRAVAGAGRTDISSQLKAFEEVSSYLRTLEMSNSQISVYLFLNDDYLVVQERSGRYRSLDGFYCMALGGLLAENGGHPVWGVTDETLEWGRTNLALARDLIDHGDYARTLGVLLISLDRAQIEKQLDHALPGQYMGICTGGGEVCIDNGVALPDGFSFPLTDTSGVFEEIPWQNTRYLFCASRLDDTGLWLVSLLPGTLVSQEIQSAQRHILGAYLAVFAVMGVLVVPLTGWMIGGIRQIRRQLLEVHEHGLRKLKHASQEDEIGQLVTAYNGMVDEMEHMLQVQYNLGRAKAGAELKALQSQINPHFLYNTLDMVSWMAKRQETENIQQVMQALSEFYKLTLSGGRDVITLDGELRLCAAYMSIQQLRWAGTIDYIVEADEELLSACIPKITLQPLIENAIKHGIMQRGNVRGSIIVSAMAERIGEKPYMVLSVTDDGAGVKEYAPEEDRGGGSHYGMKNIEMRLSLYYEEEIHIRMESEADLGTSVSFTVPVVTQEEVEDEA